MSLRDAEPQSISALPSSMAVVVAAMSVIVSASGLVLLRATQPSASVPRPLGVRFAGIPIASALGFVLFFIGLVLGSFPLTPERIEDHHATIARLVRCLLLPLSWTAERYFFSRAPLPFHQNLNCALVFICVILYQWGSPRPWDDVTYLMAGEVMGCRGGYRFWFQVYAAGYMTGAGLGFCLLFPSGATPCGLARREVQLVPVAWESDGITRLRRKVMPFLYGAGLAGAGVIFKIGVVSDSLDCIALGVLVLLLSTAFAWDQLWRQELTLGSWAPSSMLFFNFLSYLQEICIFQDLRWAPDTDTHWFAVHVFPGIYLMSAGVTMMLILFPAYLVADDSVEWGARDAVVGAESTTTQKSKQTMTSRMRLRRPCQLIAVFIFPFCMGSIFLGVTKPLLTPVLDKPHFFMEPAIDPVDGTEVGDGADSFVTSTTTPVAAVPPNAASARANVGGFDPASFIAVLSRVYQQKMPASGIVVIQLCFMNPITLAMHALLVMIRPDFWPDHYMKWSQNEVFNGAKGRFLNPMVNMLIVAWINFWDPMGGAFKVDFGPGFWYLVLHAFLTMFLSMALELDEARLHGEGYEPVQHDSLEYQDVPTASESESPPLNSSARMARKWKEGLLLLLTALIGCAMYLGFDDPFLWIQVRVGGVVTSRLPASANDLWKSLTETSPVLGVLTAFTVVFSMLFWVFALLLQIRYRSSRLATVLVNFAQRWTMGPQWMSAILLLYIVLSMHAGDPEAIIQVCYEFPIPPVGPLSIVVMGVGIVALGAVAKSLLPPEQQSLPSGRSPSLPKLPGGFSAWVGGGVVIFVSTFVYLTLSGPAPNVRVETLRDVNNNLAHSLANINAGLSKQVPTSYGDCEALKAFQMSQGVRVAGANSWSGAGQEVAAPKRCVGHGPIFNSTAAGVRLVAKWITGLDTVKVDSIRVMPPTFPPRWKILSAASREKMHRWHFVINGQFTNLLIRLQANVVETLLGREIYDKVVIDDNVCCSKPVNFTIQVSTECTEDRGFHEVHLSIPYLDLVDFAHMPDSGFHPIEAFDIVGQKIVQMMEQPFKRALLRHIERVVEGATAHLEMRTTSDTINPMVYIGEMVEQVLVLNAGERCPMGNDDPQVRTRRAR